ncbi:hypothetical protein D3C76_1576660 [compost metagenome]
MAAAAIESLLDPELIQTAQRELQERLHGEVYDCLVPADVHPPKTGAATLAI